KLCEKLGINARKRFEQEFTAHRYAQSYTKLYSELFGNVC
ncbi:TPA: glycosyl transferase family 1, partial [Vibrio cholerae]|nr:glycosyl transferase family 1 [Vibrio cholerae]